MKRLAIRALTREFRNQNEAVSYSGTLIDYWWESQKERDH
jgi:hypothetical protein